MSKLPLSLYHLRTLIRFFFGGLLLLGVSDGLRAQEAGSPATEKVPQPAPPYVRQAAPHASWSILFQVADQAAAPATPSGSPAVPALARPKVLKEIDVTKVEDIRREISVWTDGTTSQLWYVGSIELTQDPAATYVTAIDPQLAGPQGAARAKQDFADFNWLTQADFVGKTNWGGHPCYYYRRVAAAGAPHQVGQEDLTTLPSPVLREAWVDAETRLPLALNDGQGHRTYLFTASSGSTLILPPAFQAEYDRFSQALKNLKKYQGSAAR